MACGVADCVGLPVQRMDGARSKTESAVDRSGMGSSRGVGAVAALSRRGDQTRVMCCSHTIRLQKRRRQATKGRFRQLAAARTAAARGQGYMINQEA